MNTDKETTNTQKAEDTAGIDVNEMEKVNSGKAITDVQDATMKGRPDLSKPRQPVLPDYPDGPWVI